MFGLLQPPTEIYKRKLNMDILGKICFIVFLLFKFNFLHLEKG